MMTQLPRAIDFDYLEVSSSSLEKNNSELRIEPLPRV